MKVYHRYFTQVCTDTRQNLKMMISKLYYVQLMEMQDIADKEMQIIHKEFIMEKESRINHQQSESRLRNIDDLTDMGFSLTRFSPIPTIGDAAPQTPVGSGTTTPSSDI